MLKQSYLWAVIEPKHQSNNTMRTNSAPVRYISARSWNRTEFYFNVTRQTWERADDVVLCSEHNADESDMVGARIVAKAENFAAQDMGIYDYVEA
jgi:hypothetical protein